MSSSLSTLNRFVSLLSIGWSCFTDCLTRHPNNRHSLVLHQLVDRLRQLPLVHDHLLHRLSLSLHAFHRLALKQLLEGFLLRARVCLNHLNLLMPRYRLYLRLFASPSVKIQDSVLPPLGYLAHAQPRLVGREHGIRVVAFALVAPGVPQHLIRVHQPVLQAILVLIVQELPYHSL